jgi:hypothetical protein
VSFRIVGMPLRRDPVLIGGLVILLILIAILLISIISSDHTLVRQNQTVYDNKTYNIYNMGNVTPEMLYAPLNVSKLAYPYPYQILKEPMSVEEAADCIRSFANNSSMDITYQGNVSTYFGIVYNFKSGEDSYSVNPMTGQVFIASVNGSPGMNVSISMGEAKSIAAQYLRDHYKGFNTTTYLTITDSTFEDHGSGGKDYMFIWNEYVDGIQTLNTATIIVDADSGKVMFYGGLDLPVPALVNDTISRYRAIEIALSSLGNFNTDDLNAYLSYNRTFNMTFLTPPDMYTGNRVVTISNITAREQFVLDGNLTQHQAWDVIIDDTYPITIQDTEGTHQAENGQRWWINVDASTGQIVSIEPSFSY